MKVYDNYEISPCTRTEEPDSAGKFYFEVCEPEKADVWTLYGHIDGEGVEAIGDFPTREAAVQVYSRITGLPFAGSYGADARLRVMLLEALRDLLGDLPSVQGGVCLRCGRIYDDEDDGIQAGDCPSEDCPSFNARAAIAQATGKACLESSKPIVIEVRGGVVQDVLHVPPGYEYEVKDYDNIEADEEAAGSTRRIALTNATTLPPDPEGMNDSRAEWAGRAVAAFQLATGADDEDVLGDLIADLRHWADRNDYDFEAALSRAQGHYEAETGGEVV